MYQSNCVCCGRKVRTDGNWPKAHLWPSAAVFDCKCFLRLMKQHGEAAAKDAAWKASKVTQNIKQNLRVEAATPGTEHNRR
jgi:hypothetical protein